MSIKLQQQIGSLVDTLLADYQTDRTIDAVIAFDQPNKEIVIDIIHKLRKIIFPGYYRAQSYRVYTVRNQTTMLLEDVIFNLSRQIAVVLEYLPEMKEAGYDARLARAQELTLAFIGKIPEIRSYVETDVQAAFDGDPAAYNKDEIIYSYPGLFAILVSRLAHQLHLLGVPIIPRIMTEFAHSQTGIDIHPGASLGRYFFIDHGTGVVIGETTTIGDHVKLYQGVTLGAKSFELDENGNPVKGIKRHPDLGSYVVVYAGATILGGSTRIGDRCVIGGNVWLTHSVEADRTVLAADAAQGHKIV